VFAPLVAGAEGTQSDAAGSFPTGFTLIELLVVLAIISVLMGIFVPALEKARRRARTMLGASNQNQIVRALNLYAIDNDNRYPPSVATIGLTAWTWKEPFVLTALESDAPGPHRAVSEYIGEYIQDASIMSCPSAPKEYKYLQRAWDAGDQWKHPDDWHLEDWLFGTYNFYWNYTGLLEDGLFKGPRNLLGGRGQSELLVSCYFGYDHWRSQGSYGSCEKFRGAGVTLEDKTSSAYWSRAKTDSFNLDTVEIKLQAGYADGHVESFTASDVVTMKVINFRTTNPPTPHTYGPGDFYLPIDALY
jgi:prepilin-type N-terminal cleavage/methylation domain-containing protein